MKTLARNLAAELHGRLRNRSPDHAQRFEVMFMSRHAQWQLGALPPESEQMRIINDFWRVQIGLMDNDTLTIRSCLVDGLDPNVWLRNFDRYVAQYVTQYALPSQPCHHVTAS